MSDIVNCPECGHRHPSLTTCEHAALWRRTYEQPVADLVQPAKPVELNVSAVHLKGLLTTYREAFGPFPSSVTDEACIVHMHNILIAAGRRDKEAKERAIPRCAGCGTTKNLHKDLGSGGPYRCSSPDCMVY